MPARGNRINMEGEDVMRFQNPNTLARHAGGVSYSTQPIGTPEGDDYGEVITWPMYSNGGWRPPDGYNEYHINGRLVGWTPPNWEPGSGSPPPSPVYLLGNRRDPAPGEPGYTPAQDQENISWFFQNGVRLGTVVVGLSNLTGSFDQAAGAQEAASGEYITPEDFQTGETVTGQPTFDLVGNQGPSLTDPNLGGFDLGGAAIASGIGATGNLVNNAAIDAGLNTANVPGGITVPSGGPASTTTGPAPTTTSSPPNTGTNPPGGGTVLDNLTSSGFDWGQLWNGLGTLGGIFATARGADDMADAARYAADLQQNQYEQTREDLAPWRQIGVDALGRLSGLYGFGTESGQPQQTSAEWLGMDPGYQFRLTEGQNALDRSLAAGGQRFSGNALRAATEYGQNFASNEFNNAYNRLAGLSGTGQVATNQIAGYGQQAATNIGNAQQNAADARASGYMGMANTLNQGIGQGYGISANNRILNQNQQYLNYLRGGG